MADDFNLDIQMPRRRFMKIAIGILNGAIALAVAVPGLGYLLSPILRKGSATWVRIGPLDKFAAGDPQKAVFSYISESGYTREEKNGIAWVVRNGQNPEVVTVFSAVCTHAGCNVAWDSSRDSFACPCHGGMYNREGEVTAGPPPRPLQKLPVRIENAQIFVQLPA